MQLNAQLVDIAGHFRPLRLILLQFSLQIGEFLRRSRAGGHGSRRDGCWLAAALAIHGHSGGGGVNDEGTGAVLTLEEEIAMFALRLGTIRVHRSIIKQRLYQRRERTLWAVRLHVFRLVPLSKVFVFQMEWVTS